MPSTFLLEIVTPEHQYYASEVDSIYLSNDSGEFGVLANHVDMISNVTICPLRINKLNHVYNYAISGGTLNFSHSENKATLFVFAIESRDEIDLDRANKAKDNAEELLSNAQSERDSKKAEIKLKRALNRIKVKQSQGI